LRSLGAGGSDLALRSGWALGTGWAGVTLRAGEALRPFGTGVALRALRTGLTLGSDGSHGSDGSDGSSGSFGAGGACWPWIALRPAGALWALEARLALRA